MKTFLAGRLIAVFLLCLCLCGLGEITTASRAQAAEAVPVVFVHGIFMDSSRWERMTSLHRLFAEKGFKLLIARVPTDGTIDEAADRLAHEIDRLLPGHGKFHIIAHSMGGFDARFAITRYGLGDRVLSLTTLSTPHRGSSVADYAHHLMAPHLGTGDQTDKILAKFKRMVQSSESLTSAAAHDFNSANPDDPRVRYFSMGFYVPGKIELETLNPLLWWGHSIMCKHGHEGQHECQNDGLVTPQSAHWGEYLGTFYGDHASEVLDVPFRGKLIYLDVFGRVLDHLKRAFP